MIDDLLARRAIAGRYKCWDFAREVVQRLTGDDIGDRTPSSPTALAVIRAFQSGEGEFEPLTEPEVPCLVVFRRPRTVPHVGVLVSRGKVAHLSESGPRVDRLSHMIRSYSQATFHRCRL